MVTEYKTNPVECEYTHKCIFAKPLIEMYLAGVSVRRVEDVTEALWGAKVSPGTISNLNQKVYVQIEEWRNRPLTVEYLYVYLDGIYLKKNWGGTIENIAILVAIGVNEAGNREVIGAMEGGKEDKESWLRFLRHLKKRGLKGVRLIVGDKCLGLVEAISEIYPEAKYQRCMVHFMRNVLCDVPRTRSKEAGCFPESDFCTGEQGCMPSQGRGGGRTFSENEAGECSQDAGGRYP